MKNFTLSILLVSAAAVAFPVMAFSPDDSHQQRIEQRCAEQPDRCEEIKARFEERRTRMQARCQENPQKCEERKARSAKRRAWCEAPQVIPPQSILASAQLRSIESGRVRVAVAAQTLIEPCQ